MATITLHNPVSDDDARSTHFFNGRLLSGEDMQNEQDYQNLLRRLTNQASGEGIAYGFEVSTPSKTASGQFVITIKPGLAINRNGQALRLVVRQDLTLIPPSNLPVFDGQVSFSQCDDSTNTVYNVSDGLFLLTVAPATVSTGRAQVSGLGGINTNCNTAFTTDAVYFDLKTINLPNVTTSDRTTLRNQLAHLCFGVLDDSALTNDPFSYTNSNYGLVDEMRAANLLTDCEVPIALIFAIQQNIQFIDMWSVRRRVTKRSTLGSWTPLLTDRAASEAEARFYQFQNHLEDIRNSTTNAPGIQVKDNFRYLPPAGMLPLSSSNFLSGLDLTNFFKDVVVRDVYLEPQRVRMILRESLAYPAIDLAVDKLIWVYHVFQTQATNQPVPQPYVIFASGYIPPFGEARYNVNRFNFNEYTVE